MEADTLHDKATKMKEDETRHCRFCGKEIKSRFYCNSFCKWKHNEAGKEEQREEERARERAKEKRKIKSDRARELRHSRVRALIAQPLSHRRRFGEFVIEPLPKIKWISPWEAPKFWRKRAENIYRHYLRNCKVMLNHPHILPEDERKIKKICDANLKKYKEKLSNPEYY